MSKNRGNDVRKEIYSIYEMNVLMNEGVLLEQSFSYLEKLKKSGKILPFGLFVDTIYHDKNYILPLIYKLNSSEKSGSYGDSLITRYFNDCF